MTTFFDDLELHDATLKMIQLSWSEMECRLSVTTQHGSAELVFSGVTHVDVPMEQPWGPSASINAQRATPGAFEIEMQSGDLVRINAASFRFLHGKS